MGMNIPGFSQSELLQNVFWVKILSDVEHILDVLDFCFFLFLFWRRFSPANLTSHQYQRRVPFYQLCMMTAVSQGHLRFVTNLWPPEEGSNSSRLMSSSLKDSACNKTASLSSRADMCWTNVLKPPQTLCAFQDTTHCSFFFLLAAVIHQRQATRRTVFTEATPCVGDSAHILVRSFTSNVAAPGWHHVRLSVHSSFLQERLGFEQLLSVTFLGGESSMETLAVNSSNHQGIYDLRARFPATTSMDPEWDLVLCRERRRDHDNVLRASRQHGAQLSSNFLQFSATEPNGAQPRTSSLRGPLRLGERTCCGRGVWGHVAIVSTAFCDKGDVRFEVFKQLTLCVRDGICVDLPLCHGTSQGIYGSRFIGLLCEGETVGKVGEVDEIGERENFCLWSVSGAARNETWYVDDNYFEGTRMCDAEFCSSWATRVHVMKCDRAVQICTCCICGCTVHTTSVGWIFSPCNRNCPNSEKKFHQWSGLEECWELQLLVFQWVWSHFDDDDEAVCRLARDPDEVVCRFHRVSL